jgi:hypothetical protein
MGKLNERNENLTMFDIWIFVLFCLLVGLGFVLAKQALYCLSHYLSFFI